MLPLWGMNRRIGWVAERVVDCALRPGVGFLVTIPPHFGFTKGGVFHNEN
jgi:hypothetical protein